MATVIEEMDDSIISLFSKLEKVYLKEYGRLYKMSRKYKNPNAKLKELLQKSEVLKDAKDLMLNKANRVTLDLIEQELANISKKMGVKVGQIAYVADLKLINKVYIDNLDKQATDVIMQNMGTYLFEDEKTAFTKVANALKTTIAKASMLMRETLNTTTRHITEKAFLKIEKDLKDYKIKYKYAGAKDGKNSPFCAKYVGAEKTRKEWIAIKEDIFIRGGHFNCRHSLEIVPVKAKDKGQK